MPHAPTAYPNAPTPIILIGGGGHALVVADSAREAGFDVAGYADDTARGDLCGAPRLGGVDEVVHDADLIAIPLILAIGQSTFRDRMMIRLAGRALATVLHPSAVVSSGARVEPGAFVGPGAVINAGSLIGAHAIVNSGAIVEHGCAVGEGAHACPRSCMAGESRLGDRAMLGAGAVILPGVSVGAEAVVGAMSLVNRDVPFGETHAGVPARVLARRA